MLPAEDLHMVEHCASWDDGRCLGAAMQLLVHVIGAHLPMLGRCNLCEHKPHWLFADFQCTAEHQPSGSLLALPICCNLCCQHLDSSCLPAADSSPRTSTWLWPSSCRSCASWRFGHTSSGAQASSPSCSVWSPYSPASSAPSSWWSPWWATMGERGSVTSVWSQCSTASSAPSSWRLPRWATKGERGSNLRLRRLVWMRHVAGLRVLEVLNRACGFQQDSLWCLCPKRCRGLCWGVLLCCACSHPVASSARASW